MSRILPNSAWFQGNRSLKANDLRRIVPAGMPGMAFEDTEDRFPTSANDTVFSDRFNRVLAAGRREPTGWPH